MRVIPNEVRDPTQGNGSPFRVRGFQTPWARSLGRCGDLGMTVLERRWLKKTLGVTVMTGSCGMLFWLALPKPPLLDGISFSQVLRDRDGSLLRVTLSADQKFRIRTRLRDISPELIDATLQFEDKHFAQHCGI